MKDFSKYEIVHQFPEFSQKLKGRYSFTDKRGTQEGMCRTVLEYTLKDGSRYYLKSFQRECEKAILPKSARTGLYDLEEIYDGYFIEKAVPPELVNISAIVNEKKIGPKDVGKVYADVLNRLHKENIIYGTPFINSSNPEGDDHLFINPDNLDARVIDYGESSLGYDGKKWDVCNVLEDLRDLYGDYPERLESALESFKEIFEYPKAFSEGLNHHLDVCKKLDKEDPIYKILIRADSSSGLWNEVKNFVFLDSSSA